MSRSTRVLAAAAAAVVLVFSGVAVGSAIDPGDVQRDIPPEDRTNAPNVAVQTEFVVTNPCRIADSRESTAGKVAANSTRTLQMTGTTGFPAQGGGTNGCGIPATAKAVVISFTTTESTRQGRLTVFPTGSALPNTTALTYYPNVKITGEITARLGTSGRINVRNVAPGATHIVADVVGYYSEPIAVNVTFPSSVLTVTSKSDQVTSVSRWGTGAYDVFVNTTIRNCVATVSARNPDVLVNVRTSNFTGRVEVFTRDRATGAGVDNQPFFLTVTC